MFGGKLVFLVLDQNVLYIWFLGFLIQMFLVPDGPVVWSAWFRVGLAGFWLLTQRSLQNSSVAETGSDAGELSVAESFPDVFLEHQEQIWRSGSRPESDWLDQ